ncbi:hypothetical protein A3F34_02175 [Candidatus Roizmanbacteria bacterium RIFCSPHIGHO2_12_FULL_44_10]|uniref:Uncharacterized protein n=1 Tax=Candidatus Roizmanbacteria bacterium RIFCSPHIGHO2_12_FULL_44_10 TaxID=1802054 RepID=A0A1F7I6R5_9BACT|nr:MAG: hypothetical protein A3F34_02175 [Candidatus Roizmanbacteria bacterium RIFCSPHIGHO2_12_FULL_44_10]
MSETLQLTCSRNIVSGEIARSIPPLTDIKFWLVDDPVVLVIHREEFLRRSSIQFDPSDPRVHQAFEQYVASVRTKVAEGVKILPNFLGIVCENEINTAMQYADQPTGE